MKDILKMLGIGSLGLGALILLIVFLFVFGVTATSLVVAFGWNVCDGHSIFGAPPLSFWQVVGVSALINLLWGVLRGGATIETK